MDKKGIDIARWNKITNYKAVRKAGVEFAIPKVINASNAPDGRFYEHMSGCSSAGIPIIGGYTYSYADTIEKAKKAADAFVRVGTPKGIATMILDLEDKSIMHLGSKIIAIINTYRETAKKADMKFLVYTGEQFYNPYLKPYAKELADIPVWWARYPTMTERKITDPVPDSRNLPRDVNICGWQYSSKGVISGVKGYIDLNVWYEAAAFTNTEKEITAQYNPFTEPVYNVRLGTLGNDAKWVQWYLWRFGKYVDAEGKPDVTQIDGVIDMDDVRRIKEVQAILGLQADGIVGKITRSVWKKI